MSTLKVNRILDSTGNEGVDADIVGNLTGNVTGNVTSSGNSTFGGSVGIGTDNPDETLHVRGLAAGIKVDSNGDSAFRWATDGVNKYSLFHNDGADALIFFDNTNNEERVRLTSGGNVGIGTNNPQRRLDVLETASQTVAQIRTAGQTKALTRYQCLGDNPVFVGAARSDFNIEMSGTDVMTIDHSNNNVEIAGNLKVSSGNGIDFSATSGPAGMQSEILDDYEEGTFTPILAQGYTGISHGTGYPVGDYVKVGQLCHISLSFFFTSTGHQSTTRVRVEGLPFAGNSLSGNFAGFLTYAFGTISLDKYDSLGWYIPNNQTYADQYAMNGPSYDVFPNANATSPGRWIQISGTYRVD